MRFLTVVLANMESNTYKHPLGHKKAFTNIFRNEKRERSSLKGKIFNDSSRTCRDTSFKPFEGVTSTPCDSVRGRAPLPLEA